MSNNEIGVRPPPPLRGQTIKCYRCGTTFHPELYGFFVDLVRVLRDAVKETDNGGRLRSTTRMELINLIGRVEGEEAEDETNS